MEISKFQKFILKFFPKLFFRIVAKEKNLPVDIVKVQDLFSKFKRIDIFPSISGGRGFILILDRKLALYFYQDGDHFIYDGFEVGDYEKGDVTVFDNI